MGVTAAVNVDDDDDDAMVLRPKSGHLLGESMQFPPSIAAAS